MRLLSGVVISMIVLGAASVRAGAAEGEGRTGQRRLFSFESAGEVEQLMHEADNIDITVVQDNCVTHGDNCARLTFKKGAAWGNFTLGQEAIKNWSDYDYFALDLYVEDEHPYTFVFELWDQDSTNYHTRCTYESIRVHPGKQTIMWQINRSKRNNKEGRTWDELEPKDKINLDALKRVKLFLTPLKDRDCVFWVDNFRLLQEDAAKPKMKVWLPQSAAAFDFGSKGAVVPGFQGVDNKTVAGGASLLGFASSEGLEEAGMGWPDPLAGKFVWSPGSGAMEFTAPVADGEYNALLIAGKVLRPNMGNRRYLLRLNDKTLDDETPSFEEFCSEKHLYRFMWTQYSAKENALWNNYIDHMYPSLVEKTTVTGGILRLSAQNYFLSALILVPAAQEEDFRKMLSGIKEKRVEAFSNSFYSPKRPVQERKPGDPSHIVYVPDHWATVMPWTSPSARERARTVLETAGAPGQRVVMRIAVLPYEDLGKCRLKLHDLQGPGKLPAENIEGHFQNYRSDGESVAADVLLPSLELDVEKNVTQCFWLWMKIPEDAAPGDYYGLFEFSGAPRMSTVIPVKCTVYPFNLEKKLPVSYGMYYGGRGNPSFPEEVRRQKYKEQLEWMREIGFTAVPVGGPAVTSVDIRARKATLRFDTTFYELAREVGMGQTPDQKLMAVQLGLARSIGRRLPGSIGAKVDQNPGLELKQPEFEEIYMDGLRQYKEFLDRMGMPVAVEIVDEPREVPNPWNRNLADTIAYGDMMHAVGITSFVTPMGDRQSGLDYTVLAEHADIISVHAGQGSKGLVEHTRAKGKTLWFYNTGKDRYSWGFYNWRMESKGRWEWHFNWLGDGGGKGGYPGDEWYNPFVARHGYAPNAPYSKYRGGMLYQDEYLNIAEGINDYAYLMTLEKAIERNQVKGYPIPRTQKAAAFLEALKKAIPEYPRVKGIASEADGALVGMGIEDEAAHMVDQWRSKIAGLIIEVMNE
ncbi:MAG: hypothetical protein JW909_09885 [Planctomycetes bacterium]|nr:hypothetical protein [Planctomycetota bacterium]